MAHAVETHDQHERRLLDDRGVVFDRNAVAVGVERDGSNSALRKKLGAHQVLGEMTGVGSQNCVEGLHEWQLLGCHIRGSGS